MFDFILERTIMQGEIARIILALIGTGITTWYDITNNKNVPNNILYAFIGIAFISNLIFYQQELFLYTVSIAIVIFGFGYLFYKLGYIGGADVYVLAAITLLLPVFPSHVKALFNFPMVLSIIIISGAFFALYFLCFIFAKIMAKKKKGKYEYLLLVPPYAILLYFFISSGLFGLAYLIIISILILSSIIFMVYKEAVTAAMADKLPISKIGEEEIAVLELMPELAKEYNIKRLLDEKELERLKKLGVNELYIYTRLPPFLPFVLAGLIISIIIGDILMYSMEPGIVIQ